MSERRPGHATSPAPRPVRTPHLATFRRAATAALACLLLPTTATRTAEPEPPAIALANYTDGTEVRYPVPLIRGLLADPAVTAVTLTNTTLSPATQTPGIAHAGHFLVLTELVPGDNRLDLQAGAHHLPITLRYRPQTNPRVVRVTYFTDNSADTAFQTPLPADPQDWRGKLDTALRLLQTFTAERLHDAGHDRATFNLEFNDRGHVDVHLVRGDLPAADYQRLDGNALYSCIAGELARKLPRREAKDLVIPAFTRFDPATGKALAHTALGGGNLALFGGGDLFAWPDRIADVQPAFLNATRVDPAAVFSDSVGRHTFWAIASTTLGAALHELGHTWGLPHCNEPQDLMTRGGDRLNRAFTFVEPPHAGNASPYAFAPTEVATWEPVSAGQLLAHRWLALDARTWADKPLTSGRLDLPAARLLLRAPYGLRSVVVDRLGADGTTALFALSLPADAREHAVPLALLGRRAGTSRLTLRVTDGEGLITHIRLADLLAGPFVQAWQVCPQTVPWESDTLPDLPPERLAQLQAAAAAAPLQHTPTAFADFLDLLPPDRQQNVAGYVFRVLRANAPCRVRLHTGSDDALRVWLNGQVVVNVPDLRAATPDADTTEVDLRAGDNPLLVEVSQRGGGWGLYLRLSAADGRALELADTGHLLPVDPAAVEHAQQLLRGPYIRDWQFAATVLPWTARQTVEFVPVDDVRRAALETEAQAAQLAASPDDSPFVDFAPHAPPQSRANVAGYALRILRTPTARTVRLLSGSDDALRVWLNGHLVQRVARLRPAQPDAESATVRLEPGDNRLLVEVTQGGGNWGLYLRLEDEDGTDLALARDGLLTRLE